MASAGQIFRYRDILIGERCNVLHIQLRRTRNIPNAIATIWRTMAPNDKVVDCIDKEKHRFNRNRVTTIIMGAANAPDTCFFTGAAA